MNAREADAVYKIAECDCEPETEVDGVRVRDENGLGRAVKEAIEVIEDAIETYGEHLSLSFNGGKDCTVLLHIYAAVLYRRRRKTQSSNLASPTFYSSTSIMSSTSTSPTSTSPISTIYIPMPSPFPEMESFIEQSAKRYRLDIFRVPCAEGSSGKKGMREALELYGHVKPGVKAILIGIRRGDPFSEKLTHRDLTDRDWPTFMRIHPIIDWTYAQVWKFLRVLRVNYCSLYDQGYTSLGSTYNTYPNPALKVESDSTDNQGSVFKPAYELEDGSLERCGRASAPQISRQDSKDGVPVACHRQVSPPASSPSWKIGQLHS